MLPNALWPTVYPKFGEEETYSYISPKRVTNSFAPGKMWHKVNFYELALIQKFSSTRLLV